MNSERVISWRSQSTSMLKWSKVLKAIKSLKLRCIQLGLIYILVLCSVFLIYLKSKTSEISNGFDISVDSKTSITVHEFDVNSRYQTPRINNLDKFGPITNETLVIAIQVHNRPNYLRHLIGSFSLAQNISKALLVFSHDVIDEHMNQLIDEIQFCRTTQIFYPYSMQKFPNVYPGQDPNDCARDTEKSDAIKMNCTNAIFPDMYGHYREAKVVQAKLHWWWKVNFIFDQLHFLRSFMGFVLFVEEDNYLAEDFVDVFDQLKSISFNNCSRCNVLSIGHHLNELSHDNIDKVCGGFILLKNQAKLYAVLIFISDRNWFVGAKA